ncbi:MAG: CinA family nicotinamide mononucleotide deamidase-related protein [Anaerolineae bacterium]|nr:MAG: CinA family nicotinamide mononucleotide deamidase-related protein [Anaerolineae bacterium]
MPTAEIITIGTELLLGETVDTNTHHIARALRDIGVDLYRTSTVGDNRERIAQILREALQRAEIIITTGGLGPTVDDPTREAVALAFGVETEFRPELWQQILERFQRYGRKPTENNRRQARIPKGAIPIENPVGTAPAFIMETGNSAVISLPGVPREMEHLLQTRVLPYLKERFRLNSIIRARVLHTSGVGESQIDARIGDLERLSNPTVGLAAHAGQVDVRITAKAESAAEADRLIASVEAELRQRLGNWIYGADDETLEQVALRTIAAQEWNLAVVEANLGGRLIQRLAAADGPFLGGDMLTEQPSLPQLQAILRATCQKRSASAGLGASLIPGETRQTLHIALLTPRGEKTTTRTFGGPPQLATRWSVNLCLDFIRRIGKDEHDPQS